MASAVVASLVAVLALGFIEGVGRFYPARAAWWRLRSRHGRRAVRAMRERIEAAAEMKTARVLAIVLVGLMLAWVAAASLFDKRWYEVVFDVMPYAVVVAALLRTPAIMRAIADRMRGYERDAGEDPDADSEGGEQGPTELAL
jgi:hypothetical protein